MDSEFAVIVVAFVAILVAVAIGVRLLVPIVAQHVKGSAGDWGRLAARYATMRRRPVNAIFGQNVVVGRVLYRRCMIVGFDADGLYLEIGFPLSVFGKRALFIPWTEVKRTADGRLFWRKAAIMSLGEPLVGTVTVPMSLFETFKPPRAPNRVQSRAAVDPDQCERDLDGLLVSAQGALIAQSGKMARMTGAAGR